MIFLFYKKNSHKNVKKKKNISPFQYKNEDLIFFNK